MGILYNLRQIPLRYWYPQDYTLFEFFKDPVIAYLYNDLLLYLILLSYAFLVYKLENAYKKYKQHFSLRWNTTLFLRFSRSFWFYLKRLFVRLFDSGFFVFNNIYLFFNRKVFSSIFFYNNNVLYKRFFKENEYDSFISKFNKLRYNNVSLFNFFNLNSFYTIIISYIPSLVLIVFYRAYDFCFKLFSLLKIRLAFHETRNTQYRKMEELPDQYLFFLIKKFIIFFCRYFVIIFLFLFLFVLFFSFLIANSLSIYNFLCLHNRYLYYFTYSILFFYFKDYFYIFFLKIGLFLYYVFLLLRYLIYFFCFLVVSIVLFVYFFFTEIRLLSLKLFIAFLLVSWVWCGLINMSMFFIVLKILSILFFMSLPYLYVLFKVLLFSSILYFFYYRIIRITGWLFDYLYKRNKKGLYKWGGRMFWFYNFTKYMRYIYMLFIAYFLVLYYFLNTFDNIFVIIIENSSFIIYFWLFYLYFHIKVWYMFFYRFLVYGMNRTDWTAFFIDHKMKHYVPYFWRYRYSLWFASRRKFLDYLLGYRDDYYYWRTEIAHRMGLPYNLYNKVRKKSSIFFFGLQKYKFFFFLVQFNLKLLFFIKTSGFLYKNRYKSYIYDVFYKIQQYFYLYMYKKRFLYKLGFKLFKDFEFFHLYNLSRFRYKFIFNKAIDPLDVKLVSYKLYSYSNILKRYSLVKKRFYIHRKYYLRKVFLWFLIYYFSNNSKRRYSFLTRYYKKRTKLSLYYYFSKYYLTYFKHYHSVYRQPYFHHMFGYYFLQFFRRRVVSKIKRRLIKRNFVKNTLRLVYAKKRYRTNGEYIKSVPYVRGYILRNRKTFVRQRWVRFDAAFRYKYRAKRLYYQSLFYKPFVRYRERRARRYERYGNPNYKLKKIYLL